MPICHICSKNCPTEQGLISHTEMVHGRSQVYRGVSAWETSRQQSGYITTGVTAVDYEYSADPEQYNHDTQMWDCGGCNKSFHSQNHLIQHMKSGVHEEHRYDCKDCKKTFASLSGQMQHTKSTGHSPKQGRLISVLISDADRSQRLMISNEPANTNHEATLYFDGSAQPNPGAGGCGWVLKDHRGSVISQDGSECDIDSRRRTTSNQAEYQGLIKGLIASNIEGVRRLEVRGDSELIIKQMTGDYQCKSPNLIELYREAKDLASRFQNISFLHIPRDENSLADSIARHFAQKLQASWGYN